MQANQPGLKGITPLHLAALCKPGSAFARLLCSYTGFEEWCSCRTEDGMSPSDFALMAGNTHLDLEIKAVISSRTCTKAIPSAPLRQLSSHTEAGPENAWKGCSKWGSPAHSSSTKDTNTFVDLSAQHSDQGSQIWREQGYESDSESVKTEWA